MPQSTSQKQDPQDKRRSLRVDGDDMSACCRVSRFMDVYAIDNISTGGALLSYGLPLPLGQTVDVAVMSNGHDPVNARAQVVRHVGMASMAVEFLPDVYIHDAIHHLVVGALFRSGEAV